MSEISARKLALFQFGTINVFPNWLKYECLIGKLRVNMSVTNSGGDIHQAIKDYLRDNPPPEQLTEDSVFRILRILEEFQFNIDRSRPRELIKREIESKS